MFDKKDVNEVRDFLIDVMEYPFMDGDFWLIPVLTSAEVGVPPMSSISSPTTWRRPSRSSEPRGSNSLNRSQRQASVM